MEVTGKDDWGSGSRAFFFFLSFFFPPYDIALYLDLFLSQVCQFAYSRIAMAFQELTLLLPMVKCMGLSM